MEHTTCAISEALASLEDAGLRTVLKAVCDSCADISDTLENALVTPVGTSNIFGDEQLTVDVISDKILFKKARDCGVVRAAASEEEPWLQEINPKGEFVLAWDPLDGSSIVDCNWAVGTIVGVYKIGHQGLEYKGADTLIGTTGRQMVASCLALYGPRHTILLAFNGTTQEFTFCHGKWVLSRKPEQCQIKPTGCKIFAPANLRAAQDLPAYKRLVDYWHEKRYTLRYTGGLVPDVYQFFIKGSGVFCNPASEKAPAKLRLLFEVAPLALLVENAGGRTSDGTGRSLLDIPLTHMEHRTPMCVGTKEEVDRFDKEMQA